MSFIFPDIDPVIYQFGNTAFKITWYSLSYVAGILLGIAYIKKLNHISILPPLSSKVIEELLTSLIIGIILGGRLGYVIFYDLAFYLKYPMQILHTWEGGMSFHGGLLGVIFACLIHSKIYKVSFLQVMDLIVCATPIGLFFGRIANFINAELYGRVTDVSWGILFPGEKLARHPSQLYESFAEGLLLFLILLFLFTKTKIQNYRGMLCGVFLLIYAFFRAVIENYREPDNHIGFVISHITMGQLLSLPMVIVGIIVILYSLLKRNEIIK